MGAVRSVAGRKGRSLHLSNLNDVNEQSSRDQATDQPSHRRRRSADSSIADRVLHPESPHSLAQSRRWSLLTVGFLTFAYYLTGWVLPRLFRSLPELNFYVVQPLLWLGLGLAAYYGWVRLHEPPPFRWSLVGAGVMVGIFHVSVLVIAGVFVGFGRAGVGVKLTNYPLNALYLGSLLVGLEFVRAYLVAVWKEVLPRVAFGLVTLVIFVAATPVGRWYSLDDAERFFRVAGGLLLPSLVVGGVATWIAVRAGAWPAIAYQGFLIALESLSPFVPDLGWLLALALGTTVPLVALGLFRGLGEDALPSDASKAVAEDTAGRRWPGWFAAGATAVVFIGFFNGTFGVRPFAVSGISMEPALEKGDLVIVREGVPPEDIRIGDIVKHSKGGLPIIHRVATLETTPSGVVITTQGDNVLSPDRAVDGADIEGRAVFVIPWVGHVVLWANGE